MGSSSGKSSGASPSVKSDMQSCKHFCQKFVESIAMSADELKSAKEGFLRDMHAGWDASKGAGAPAQVSSLKMLTSHVNVFATGEEQGVYFAVDLGGSNLRILRVNLVPGQPPAVTEHRKVIPAEVTDSKATGEALFDFIALTAKELTDKFGDKELMPVGFTFSFPMSQDSISSGKLIEWTKGFSTGGCVGNDPANMLSEAFKRCGAPLYIVALCNDTVGTLMTCAYEFQGCPTCRIGVILGTGTNAAYVDPSLGNLIVNIEWGGFDHPSLKRTRYDMELDRSSQNPGKQVLEKLVSGLYLGEIARRATIDILSRTLMTETGLGNKFFDINGFDTSELSEFLKTGSAVCSDSLKNAHPDVLYVLKTVGEAVMDRSAAVCAAALAAVAEKSLAGKRKDSITDGTILTVGIDGSLFIKGHNYGDRLRSKMALITGEEFSNSVKFVRSSDGSGVGAAVIAAAVSKQQKH